MGGKRYSAREREELLNCLSNWQESVAGFAKVHGVSVGTLYNWKQQLADRSPEADLGFVEIGQPLSPELGVHLTLNIGGVGYSPFFGQKTRIFKLIFTPRSGFADG